jgi:hypothetical protein
VSDCTGCQNTRALFLLTEILWDHKFLSDINCICNEMKNKKIPLVGLWCYNVTFNNIPVISRQ